jgi:hypothetical protein
MDQARLLMIQGKLEKDLKQPFVELPLGDTIYQVILQGDQDKGQMLQKEFKVPDKRFCPYPPPLPQEHRATPCLACTHARTRHAHNFPCR